MGGEQVYGGGAGASRAGGCGAPRVAEALQAGVRYGGAFAGGGDHREVRSRRGLYLEPGGRVAKAVPVEFKRGRDKDDDCDRAQLCAQALCLEEMLGVEVTQGAFYYLAAHRRTSVEIGTGLRARTRSAIAKAHEIVSSGSTPGAVYEAARCDRCSLLEACMPATVGAGGKKVERYVRSSVAAARKDSA